jgi:hypothetical protein
VHRKALLPKIKNTRINSAQGAELQTKRVKFDAAKTNSAAILPQEQTKPPSLKQTEKKTTPTLLRLYVESKFTCTVHPSHKRIDKNEWKRLSVPR